MMSSRLFWSWLGFSALLCVLGSVIVLVVASGWQNQQANVLTERRLKQLVFAVRDSVAGRMKSAGDDDLQNTVARLGENIGARITVIDPSGHVLADSHQRPSEVGNYSDLPEVREAEPNRPAVARRTTASTGTPMVFAALRVEAEGENLGTVLLGQAADEVYGPESNLLRPLGVALALFSVVVLAATGWFADRMGQPLRRLTQTTKAATGGDYTPCLDVSSGNEIGELRDALNQLLRNCSHRIGQLRQNNQRLAAVLESMNEGVIAIDDKQRILFVNEAARTLLRIRATPAEGRSLIEVARHHLLHEIAEAALRHQGTQRAELETSGQNRRHMLVQTTQLPGAPSPGAVMVLHDVTELRRLENMRQEFFANVSHELKTPLSSIKAYAETLLNGAFRDTRNNLTFVARIQEQAERLHQLILDMLSLSRIESGKQLMEIAPVSLRPVVQSVASHHRAAADAKRIELEIAEQVQGTKVHADEEGLRQILSNLVDNAVKYTPEDGHVSIGWRHVDGQVAIDVKDTGIGIPVDSQLRIFERFYRVDKARSRELGGTGLGLSIVKHLAQSFGGSVEVTSEPNRGSTFTVRLPLAS